MCPLPAYLSPLTIPLARLYEMAIARRNKRFDRGGNVERIDRPVISVGNITTGGTGKTPMVVWLARQLLEHGRHPVIAMRGYKKTKSESSDEQREYNDFLPEVPLVVGPDRVTGLRDYFSQPRDSDCVLLDDGFQHRQLARDLDLVLIDATRHTFNNRLLPAGQLREPLKNLARADAVIVTRAEYVDDRLAGEIDDYHARSPLAWSRHRWQRLRLYDHSAEQTVPVDWLDHKRLVTLLGVGNPQSVIGQVELAGAEVVENIPARDHERFSRRKLQRVREAAAEVDAVMMTRKDWVRTKNLIDFSHWPSPVIVPELTIDMFAGKDDLRQLLFQTVRSTIPP